MTSKQNVVFFLGLALIAMVFWVNGYWSVLWNHAFNSQPSTGNLLPSVSPGGTKPVNGKCPVGSIKAYGKCWPATVDPIPPTGGGLT